MHELNTLDKKIIYELENNSRQSLSKISRTLKTSQQVVSYRLINLEKENIVKKHITIIDYCSLGYKNCLVGIKIKPTDVDNKNKLLTWLKNKKNVFYVCDCCEKYNYIFEFFYKKEEDILTVIEEFKNNFFEMVCNYNIFLVYETSLFNKDYFFEDYRNSENEIIIETKNKVKKIDDLEKKILLEISENSKKPTTEIAKKLSVTPETVVNKLKKLNQTNIILGYRLFTNLNNNIYYYFIKLKNSNKKEIINYLKNIKNTTTIFKLLGEYDLIVKLEINQKKDIYKELNNIKKLFCDIVDEIDLIFVYKEHKLNFFCF
jgi:DNA-binding Lrp family transcriptional regulator